MTLLIVSSILSLICISMMLKIIAVGFDCKHQMLKLFQFGYSGLLILSLLHRFVMYAEIEAGIRSFYKSDVIYYTIDLLNAAVVIPYFFYCIHKKRTLKNI